MNIRYYVLCFIGSNRSGLVKSVAYQAHPVCIFLLWFPGRHERTKHRKLNSFLQGAQKNWRRFYWVIKWIVIHTGRRGYWSISVLLKISLRQDADLEAAMDVDRHILESGITTEASLFFVLSISVRRKFIRAHILYLIGFKWYRFLQAYMQIFCIISCACG